MKSPFYVHLSSKDSQEYFPNNEIHHFTVKLPEVINLGGPWEVTLCDVIYPAAKTSQVISVLTDICNDSIVGDRKLPLLREFRTSRNGGHREFGQLHYKIVNTGIIERITIYIKRDQEKVPSFTPKTLSCTLHFQPQESN